MSEPAKPLSAWRRILAGVACGLTVGFFLATLALCVGLLNQGWNDSHAVVALAVAAGLLGLLVLGTLVSRRRRGPAMFARIARWRPWLLAAWGLVLAATVAEFVWQDQLRFRGAVGFQSTMARIEASDELAQCLGRPVRPGWLVSGRQGIGQGKDGSYDYGWFYEFSVAGPKGSGRVQARRTDSNRRWSDSLVVVIDGSGERLELAKPGPAQERPPIGTPPPTPPQAKP